MNTHTCPQCKGLMHSVKVVNHQEHPFEVEQCSVCGGLWFDKFEHHRVHEDKIATLDPVNEIALEMLSGKSVAVAKCPKDSTELELFDDFNFPKDLRIDHCSTCGGLWFNRGDFRKYRETYKRRAEKRIKKEHAMNPTQKLTLAYLKHDAAMRKKEVRREATKATSREVLYSFLTFLLVKNPVHVGAIVPAVVQPLWTLLMKLFGVSHAQEKVYVDMGEFKSLVAEVSGDV